MGQLPSSLRGSQSSIQSDLKIGKNLNRIKQKTRPVKESFRRHSILNLFQINLNNGADKSSSNLKNIKKFNNSELNINQINTSNSSLRTDTDGSTNTIDSIRSDTKFTVRNRTIENLKKRDTRSVSPLATKRIAEFKLDKSKKKRNSRYKRLPNLRSQIDQNLQKKNNFNQPYSTILKEWY